MGTSDIELYTRALKSQPMKEVKLSVSERQQAKINQDNKCAKCSKRLRPYFYKFVRNPSTKKIEIICSECAIEIKH